MQKSIITVSMALSFAVPALAYEAPFTATAPNIDGQTDSDLWDLANWQSIEHIAVGEVDNGSDFKGQYKVLWDHQKIYLLVSLEDDILIDTHPDPLLQYWDDDALEIFIDQDNSGGIHLDNHNAYAYHIGLDNQVVDIDTDGKPALFNSHLKSKWQRNTEAPFAVTWEVALEVYDESNNPDQRVSLSAGQILGFMLSLIHI